ncbi:MAG: lysophospholipid acyltransferase family protein [Magnetococcus sp. DMHC-6]
MNRYDKPMEAKYYWEWLALQGVSALMSLGTMTQANRRARFLSHIGKRILRSEWAWANTNLNLVYGPQLTPNAREKLATLAFENIFCSFMEGMRADEMHFENEGIEHLHQACRLGRGVILCSIHLGCWEPGLKQLAKVSQIPAVIVYREANNPLSEKAWMALRASYGVEWLPRGNNRGTLRALQEKKLLGLMIDIGTGKGGVTAPHLGIPALCPPGPAKLAIHFQCPIVPIVATRRGADQATFRVGEPIEPPLGNQEGMIPLLTDKINRAFDNWIHTYAEQYNWLHSRWRRRPEGADWKVQEEIENLWKFRTAPFSPLSERVLKLIS